MSEIKLEAKEGIDQDTIESVKLLGEKYKYGFSTDIDMDYAPKGLSEEIVKLISEKNSKMKSKNLDESDKKIIKKLLKKMSVKDIIKLITKNKNISKKKI